jgi:hypothetical protein
MRTSVYLPVGTKGNVTRELISKGDVVELATGEKVTFMEAKRTRWLGRYNDKGLGVPFYRDRLQTTPYILAVVGRDESVIVKGTDPTKLTPGDIFSLEGHKETFMYTGEKTRPRSAKKYITGKDLASGKKYTIDAKMKILKVDIDKLKRELKIT